MFERVNFDKQYQNSTCLSLTNHLYRYYFTQVEGFKMNLIYFDLYQSTRLEKFVTGINFI